jgi:gamma-glutamyltranspeptidase/glutathione hydrolase
MTVNAHRPTIAVTRHAIAAGHYLASTAGFDILQAGGNAIDAGVAAGIALGVLQSDLVNCAGVAPIMIYLAEKQEVVTIAGLGAWPRALDPELFMREHGGKIPLGVLRTVVPAAPDAWITALRRYGTMGFGDVAAAAIRLARDGFPMYPLMADSLKRHAERHNQWPSSAAVYVPGGRPPEAGEVFYQKDLAASLQYMADEEKAALSRGRDAGLEAARDAFYRGDIARKFVAYHKAEGGLLSAEDLANYHSPVGPPERRRFGDLEVFTCGAWCQGPALLQTLALLDGTDVKALGHNSADYVHHLTEAVKLAFADREAYYTDPAMGSVPLPTLISSEYAAERRKLIDPKKAWPEMPPRSARRGGAGAPPERRQPVSRARHLLCLRRRSLGQSVLGDAERWLLRLADRARHRAHSIEPRLAVAPRPEAPGRRRAGQAAAPDAEPGAGDPRRRRAISAIRHTGRRRADPGDAAGSAQHLRAWPGRAERD